MKLVAQRVLRPSNGATGINAYCYFHPGCDWLDAPPDDLGRGELRGRIIEVDPPSGNRVRSYLDITTPDHTTDLHITESVLSGADLLQSGGESLPWTLIHLETRFEFNLELALVQQWELELRMLLGYALQARKSAQQNP